jgi:hypothetical protein
MKLGSAVVLVFALALSPAQARATQVSLGANLGFVQLSSGGSSSVLFQAPFDPSIGFQPGLRLGFPGESGMDDFSIDLGGLRIEDTHVFAVLLHYRRCLVRAATSPYLTIGGGFHTYGFGGRTETNPVFGGGAGLIHRLPDQRGALRLEFRVDDLKQDQGADDLLSVGVKAGFDLYLR